MALAHGSLISLLPTALHTSSHVIRECFRAPKRSPLTLWYSFGLAADELFKDSDKGSALFTFTNDEEGQRRTLKNAFGKIIPLSWCCTGLWSDKHSLLSCCFPLSDWNLFEMIKEQSSSPVTALRSLTLLIGTKEAQSPLSEHISKRIRPFCCTVVTPNAVSHG